MLEWMRRWRERVLMAIRTILRLPPFKGHSPCALKYEPATWNDCPNPDSQSGGCDRNQRNHQNHKQGKNNCYNYACNIQNDTYAEPGRGSGKPLPPYPVPIVHDDIATAARADGLTPVKREETCPKCCYKIALVFSPHPDNPNLGLDYHWYRQNDNGRWSHKRGNTKVTDKDASGKTIYDPEKADRGPYTIFCGYFCVCKDKVEVA